MKLIAALAAALLAANALEATPVTIIDVAATDPISIWGAYGGSCSPACERGQVAGWSQTDSYTNVSVSADLLYLTEAFDSSAAGVGHAYLMRQIGPGTTVADQVAFTTFAGLPNAANLGMTTLFTGLTLGPGSYYLVLGSDANSVGLWSIDPTPTITTAPGSVSLGRFSLNLDDTPLNPGFLPGEDVQSFSAHNLPFRVVGESRDQLTPVPEPASLLLLGTGMAAVAARRRTRVRR